MIDEVSLRITILIAVADSAQVMHNPPAYSYPIQTYSDLSYPLPDCLNAILYPSIILDSDLARSV